MNPCVFIALDGLTVTESEQQLLQHPLVAGLTLFARNYQSPTQLRALTDAIKTINPHLLIAVDQEGGRVQRFRDGFTLVPSMKRMTAQLLTDERCSMTDVAWLIGAELKAFNIDINFAPVLDIDRGLNTVIGDRAFHQDPQLISQMALQFSQGLQQAGILAVGKHFPGHGGVALDSHVACPIDERSMDDIAAEDLLPFKVLLASDHLHGLMTSHVIYSEIDEKPATFSTQWLKNVLRKQLGFSGALFSDDLSMAAAQISDTPCSILNQSLRSGCDYVLLCNYQGDCMDVLSGIEQIDNGPDRIQVYLQQNSKQRQYSLQELHQNERYRQVQSMLKEMGD